VIIYIATEYQELSNDWRSNVFRVNVLVLAAACAVSAVPAEAQFVSSLHILPVVAKLAGAAGTDWMTAMSVSNVSDQSVNVTAMFFRKHQQQPFAVRARLQPGSRADHDGWRRSRRLVSGQAARRTSDPVGGTNGR
jgi:hypothetical protein